MGILAAPRVASLLVVVALGACAPSAVPVQRAPEPPREARGARPEPESEASPPATPEAPARPGTPVERAAPARVSAEYEVSCAARGDRGVFCWGKDNGDALFGHDLEIRPRPVRIDALGKSERVAAGLPTCAIQPSGDVVCLERGIGRHRAGPWLSQRFGDAVAIAAGGDAACAIRGAGALVCWGRGYGEPPEPAARRARGGTGKKEAWRPRADDISTVPVALGIDDASSVSMGVNGQGCAARKSGAVACFGFRSGWIDGKPTSVDGITDAVSVAVGTYAPSHACALRRTGQVACWGSNVHGQLGDATKAGAGPAAARGVESAVAVAAGGDHSCALLRSGEVMCWGRNDDGELGDGTTEERDAPVLVRGLADAISISAGYRHTCAERASGAVLCWGLNVWGQLGNGLSNRVAEPRPVPGVESVAQISAGPDHTCARHDDGGVSCWGDVDRRWPERELDRMTPTRVPGVTDALDLSAGEGFTCAVTRARGLVCWRKDGYGASPEKDAVERSPIEQVRRVFSGGGHGCVLLGNGDVACVGDNREGQLGTGPRDVTEGYRAAPFAKDAQELALGHSHTCALERAGTVLCWGWGYTDDPNKLPPGSGPLLERRSIAGLRDALTLDAGFGHTCAARKTGDVVCFGRRARPVRGVRGAVEVASGWWSSCALTARGEVWCWRMSLEDGAPFADDAPAERVRGVDDAVHVTMGNSHACALLRSRRVVCWGSSDHGELGIGRTALQPLPVAVVDLP